MQLQQVFGYSIGFYCKYRNSMLPDVVVVD